ncbi:hypothetical protein CAPTEDRAFT_158876 [Capitella teleta]|uniref:Fas-binding factor 1 C-terminal domain-containing protein n=1 Tax=Capitella teleta TaxID=283909 RepID=R7VD80_CAPTE|nr:hypothetical protein CAPTEDRAFT_158876 [Capitella teleta]|eukprot:ELU16783.1 hypothetical protein CAPTEDRAFT_158876 [Capitella teleta]
MTQLSTERKQLAEERAHFNVAQRLRMEQEQRDTIKTLKADAEADSTVKVLNDEKAHLEARVREFELERKKFMGNQEKLEHEMKSITIEKEKLEQIALQVRQRSKDIEEMCLSAAQAREEGQQALIIAKSTETEHKQRLNKIQVEVANLRSKERQIAEERLALAKEKKTLETSRSSMLCVSCRTPMKEVQPRVKMTPAAHNLYHTIENKQQMVPNLDPGTSTHNKISADIVVDKSFRNWRRQAAKDKEYLEEESAFLDVIKQSPYHSDASI